MPCHVLCRLLQADAIIKSYQTPILLIEFDGDKTFALTGQSEVAVELDHRSPQARLVLLLLHFPKLRCVCMRVRVSCVLHVLASELVRVRCQQLRNQQACPLHLLACSSQQLISEPTS